jgi:hypothetical protein
MNKFHFLGFFLFICSWVSSQEIKCDVKINSERVNMTNKQIFNTLESSLTEFINNTRWTNVSVRQHERINCSMFINVSAYDSDTFVATLQVQASRPVFNATYSTPIFSYNDKEFTFRYVEFENLFFNPNSFDSNLVSMMAFYVYTILGLDADSFAPLGGTPYFAMAQQVVSNAQQSNFKGWRQSDGNQTRFIFLTDLISSTFNPVRLANYEYHVNGLDKMSENVKTGKQNIIKAISDLSKIHTVRPNAFVTRVFFDTKSDEIQALFTGGPSVNISDLVDNLNRVSPTNASKWANIKM